MAGNMSNGMEILLFNQRRLIQLQNLARKYNMFHNMRATETDSKDKELIRECQRQIFEIVKERDSVAEFQELLVRYSGYTL